MSYTLKDLAALFKSGREYLDWIKEGSWLGNMNSCTEEAYLWEIKGAVSPGYDVPIPEEDMCKALERSMRTGEVIALEPDPEFLPGGTHAGQLDGWSYHLKFMKPDVFFKLECPPSPPEDLR